MSDKLESNSHKANYHLEKLTQIINQLLSKDIELTEEKNKYQELILNYKELEEKYNNLKRDIECQTDFDVFNDSFNDKNVCQLFDKNQTFIGTNRKSDILCNDSTYDCFGQQIDGELDLKSECLSIDEIPDSLENSIQNDSNFEDNDCLIVEQNFSDKSVNEIQDSLNNSPISSSKTFNEISDKTVNHLNDIKVKAEKCESRIEEKNFDCLEGEKSGAFDSFYDKNKNVKKEKIDSFFEIKTKTNCNGIKVEEEKCEKSIDKRNINCVKEEKREVIDSFHEIMKVKKEKSSKKSDSVKPSIDCQPKRKEIEVKNEKKPINGKTSSPVKYVIKTLGPSVRKKEERKKLNGYTCKECEDYYRTRDLTEDELKGRLKACSRHRSKYSPVKSPPYFWETDFPSTPECIKRGIFLIDDKPSPNVTQRRKKPKQSKLDFN
jgi:hypothetical protein